MGEKVKEALKIVFPNGRDLRGSKNPNYGKKREQRTEEQLENYSKAAIQRVLDGKSCVNNGCFKRGHFVSKKANKTFFFRSSYEERMMCCLEKDKTVVLYCHEPFYIKLDTGKRYLPDFIIHYANGQKIILELKNSWNRTFETTIEKRKAAEAYCQERDWKYEMWGLEEIVALEKELDSISSTKSTT